MLGCLHGSIHHYITQLNILEASSSKCNPSPSTFGASWLSLSENTKLILPNPEQRMPIEGVLVAQCN